MPGPVMPATQAPATRYLANDAWEALLSAHAVLMKEFAAEDIWGEVSMREYDVLYALSKCRGSLRLSELNRHVLLSQPARQPRPNANRGDNVTGESPYQDTAENVKAEYPSLI